MISRQGLKELVAFAVASQYKRRDKLGIANAITVVERVSELPHDAAAKVVQAHIDWLYPEVRADRALDEAMSTRVAPESEDEQDHDEQAVLEAIVQDLARDGISFRRFAVG